MFLYEILFVIIKRISADSDDFNGIDCTYRPKEKFICARGPKIEILDLEDCYKNKPARKKNIVIQKQRSNKGHHKFPAIPCFPKSVYPGFGNLPPCPPSFCPPQKWCPPNFCPPQQRCPPQPPYPTPAPFPCPYPTPYVCKPKFNFIGLLERLTIERQAEITAYFTNRAKVFNDNIRSGMNVIGTNLGQQISQANAALINSLNNIIIPQQSQLLQNLSGQINQTNNAILTGLNSLINTANAQVEANIVALAALAAAAIQASITDLTTSTGTLQQILAITQGVTSGFNSLLATQTQQELANVNTLLTGEASAIQAPVTAAIAATNTAIQNLAQSAAAQSMALVIGLFKRFIGEANLFLEALMKEYGTEIDRLVIAYFS